jgi:hypothetical protein
MLRLALLLAALAAVSAVPGLGAQTVCLPAVLAYDGNAYLAEEIPASVSVARGEQLGGGELDSPIGAEGDRCERERGDANVVALEGIDPLVAVGVEGRPAEAFILGSKCIGFAGEARWECLRTPLSYEGRLYIGARYPLGSGRSLELGAPLGAGELGADAVDVVAFEDIEPDAAVGLRSAPATAYVAIGVCQYGRFGETVLEDNLRRCLEAPFWLYFDPPGGEPGGTITARADRPLPSDLSSAEISLARSQFNADIIPEGASQTPIGAMTVAEGTLTFEIPDLPEGRYEAVLTCEGCGKGARTTFPAGSLVILEGGGGGINWGVVVLFVVGAIFVVLLVLSIVARRRGWTRGRPAGPADGGGSSGGSPGSRS